MTRKPGSLPREPALGPTLRRKGFWGSAQAFRIRFEGWEGFFIFPPDSSRTPSAASARRESGRRSPACSVKSKVESPKSKVQSRKSKVKHRRVSKSPCRDCSRSCCAQRRRARRRFGERSLTLTVARYPEREWRCSHH